MKWIIDYLYPRNFNHAAIPDLAGKVILITGGCSGLGFEVAKQCALHNASKIIIVSLPSARLEEAVRLLSASLTDPEGNTVRLEVIELTVRTGNCGSCRSRRFNVRSSCSRRGPKSHTNYPRVLLERGC